MPEQAKPSQFGVRSKPDAPSETTASMADLELQTETPACYLLNWNPSDFPWPELESEALAIASGRDPKSDVGGRRWSVVTKKIRKGDRLFLMRVGIEPKGIVGAAIALGQPERGPHWDGTPGKTTLYVKLKWDALLSPTQPPLSLESLRSRVSGEFNWTPQGSGRPIPVEVAGRLGSAWCSWLQGTVDTPLPHDAPPSLASIAMDYFGEEEKLSSIVLALKRKRAVVLQGSPGTGKSFIAGKIAHYFAGSRGRVVRVQFHPAYSYEDFVRGIRPKGSEFVVENGPLVRIAEAAKRAPNEQFVLFIDEINRGNVAKILGEALSLIEADKRDERHAVDLGLEYRGSHKFWIPPNVAVLATMNTADRSIALVDYALRRRFAFFRLEPAYEHATFLKRLMDQFSPSSNEASSINDQSRSIARQIVDSMLEINAAITAERSFGRDFAIGHSFFCNFDAQQGSGPGEWSALVFEEEICPLIEEYCAEHPKLREKLLGLVPKF